MGSLKGTKFVVSVEPWHGNQIVAYTPGADATKPFERNLVDDRMRGAPGFRRMLTPWNSHQLLMLQDARPALRDFEFINHGVNGDLAWNGLQRLDKVEEFIAKQPIK